MIIPRKERKGKHAKDAKKRYYEISTFFASKKA